MVTKKSGKKKNVKRTGKSGSKSKPAKKTAPKKKKPAKNKKEKAVKKASSKTKKGSKMTGVKTKKAASSKSKGGTATKSKGRAKTKKAPSKAKTKTKTKTNTKATTKKVKTKTHGVPKAAKPPAKTKPRKSRLQSSELSEYYDLLMLKRGLILGTLSKMETAALKASEQDSSVDNMADYGTDNYEQDFTLGLIENTEGVIQEIDDALRRLEAKSFGVCEECECNIPKARLRAIPYARYCVQCQSNMEAS
jgi:RNA polymerase-binding transcription factor DksA